MRFNCVVSDFEKVIKKFAKDTDTKINDVVKKTSFAIFREMTFKTAVGNWSSWKAPRRPYIGYVGGQLRSSLIIGTRNNTRDTANSSAVPVPKLPPLKQDPIVYINSNLPYSMRVLQEGWSKQTPKNMVDKAVKRQYDKLKAFSA